MITLKGTFEAQRDVIERRIAARLQGAVRETSAQAQGDLRAQARAAGFRDGGRAVANTWRRETYPKPGIGPKSWRPGALIWSKVPLIVEAFDRGAVITAKGRFMAIPTPQNLRRKAGRGGKRTNLLMTTEQMVKSDRAFFRPLKGSRNALLWCLRLDSKTTRRGNTQVFGAEGRKLFKGNSVVARARRRGFAQVGYVAMFVMLRRVSLRKRLDLKGAAGRAQARLRSGVSQALRA
jgi:hypothetical protein